MSLAAYKLQILKILVENLGNAQPQVVESEYIAGRLNISVKDICQMMRILHEKEMVESDPEGRRSLITRQGLNCLEAASCAA